MNKHILERMRNAETWQEFDEITEVAVLIVEKQIAEIFN